ncbi:FxsA family protein [Rhodococcus sp. D2-41]|uniref:FxsA family protein n=1 Tax=Speluncibacter jeojiensis TaxID=2710754 RepID=UPI0024106F06|nr:FxsA family protein [Rhodococcus sp. D2-41]MDG3012910.1 FxsA family protein [Rhodococcus sp. D2-41]
MMLLLFVLYLLVEVAAVVWVASMIGVLWTVALLLGSLLVGFLLLASQGRRVLRDLRRATRGDASPGGVVADGAMVAAAAVLLIVPGLVTGILGILLLIPPTRWALRPLLVLVGARRFGLVATAGSAGYGVYRHHRGAGATDETVIDGTVVDSTVLHRPSIDPYRP